MAEPLHYLCSVDQQRECPGSGSLTTQPLKSIGHLGRKQKCQDGELGEDTTWTGTSSLTCLAVPFQSWHSSMMAGTILCCFNPTLVKKEVVCTFSYFIHYCSGHFLESTCSGCCCLTSRDGERVWGQWNTLDSSPIQTVAAVSFIFSFNFFFFCEPF